jgi:hypothetical protein
VVVLFSAPEVSGLPGEEDTNLYVVPLQTTNEKYKNVTVVDGKVSNVRGVNPPVVCPVNPVGSV